MVGIAINDVFTVTLAYPVDSLDMVVESYIGTAKAGTSEEALNIVRRQAAIESVEYEPGDFTVMSVFPGDLEPA